MERKLVTMVFADLVGSTALASDDDPERVRSFLDRFYVAMAAAVEAAGGAIEQFAGDAVYATFGARAAQEDHAERALHAALSMRGRLGELFGDGFALRIGVNTGEVAVGPARVGGSFVSGDAVNVAARLEQGADPGEILVAQRTVAAVRGAFEFMEPRTIAAKGKEDGVRCCAVVRALSLQRPRGGGLPSVFVGRSSELELLQATYRRVVDNSVPHLVTIVGDAGVGKSRLVGELWGWLAGQTPQPLLRIGRCLSYGQTTFLPIGEICREQFGILDSDSSQTVRQRVADHPALGLALGLDVPEGVHPLVARNGFLESWIELVQQLAAEQPVVVLVDDLHWAEAPLLDLLERAVGEVHGRLLVIGTARPELLDMRPTWPNGRRNSTFLWLEPLAAADAARLADELVASALPDRLHELVVARAEGNPFFLEELLGTLVDRGVLERGDEAWAGRDGLELEVPDSVHALVAARIDLLPPTEKRALQAAAVGGRVFWAGPTIELLDGEEPSFALLEERDFIRRRPSSSIAGEREFSFKHAITRDVAYAGLSKRQRARLHAAFAAWLARLDEEDRYAALIAHHYAQAVRPEDADLAWADEPDELERLGVEAVFALRRAAELAASRYEIDDALALLGQALALASAGRARVDVLRAIARAHALNYDGEGFWTGMQEAIAEAEDDELRSELYADLAFETALRAGIWRRSPERDVVANWIESALAGSPDGSPARAKALVAKARWAPGAPEARAAASEATELAERLGDVLLRSAAWDARGIVAFVAGETEDGLAWASRRFELLDQISDPDVRADTYAAPITGYILTGDIRQARRLAQAHGAIASRLTAHHRVHAVSIDLEVEELVGRWDVIQAQQGLVEAAIEANLETPCVRNPRSLLVCSIANEYLGEPAAARIFEERALEHWMDGYAGMLDTPRLRLAVARGDLEQAERLLAHTDTAPGWHRGWFVFANAAARLDGLAALCDRQRIEAEAPGYLRPGTYFEPFARRALGQVREDPELIGQALSCFEALGLDWHAGKTRMLLAPRRA